MQIVTSILLLKDRQIDVLQTSLVGGILSNMHLMLGLGFFCGGLRYREQIYNSTVTQSHGALLLLAVTALIIPTATDLLAKPLPGGVLKQSRVASVVLPIIYLSSLLFQLKSHAYIFEATPQQIIDQESSPGPAAGWLDTTSSSDETSDSSSLEEQPSVSHRIRRLLRRPGRDASIASTSGQETTMTPAQPILPPLVPTPGSTRQPVAIGAKVRFNHSQADATILHARDGIRRTASLPELRSSPLVVAEDIPRTFQLPRIPQISNMITSERGPRVHLATVIILTLFSTSLVGFHTSFTTDSLQGLMNRTGLTTSFVGLILLPLLTNDMEPIHAAVGNKIDLCIALTIGKCLQTALLVIPAMVLLGWIMGIEEMTLSFDGFEIAALLASVLYIDFTILDGRSN